MMYSSFTYLALLTAASVGLTGAIPAPPPPAQSSAREPTPGGDAEGAECGELNVFLTYVLLLLHHEWAAYHIPYSR